MNKELEKLNSLTHSEQQVLFNQYLPKLARSISLNDTNMTTLSQLTSDINWGEQRYSKSWEARAKYWYKNSVGYCLRKKAFIVVDVHADDLYSIVPMFSNYYRPILQRMSAKTPVNTVESLEEETNMNKFKNTADQVLEVNKNAAKVAAKQATGKTANTFFMKKIMSKFPWYVKLFGKKKEFEQNPIAKMAMAQTAVALSKHFAGDNQKLNYISEAMVEEAMVDISVNSAMLDKLIEELADAVNLPDEL